MTWPRKEIWWFFWFREAAESKLVKLETSLTDILPPNGECSLIRITVWLQSPFLELKCLQIALPTAFTYLITAYPFQIDRTHLSSSFCISSEEDEFKFNYQIPYSKMNCEVFTSTEFLPYCSHTPFYGIKTSQSCHMVPTQTKKIINWTFTGLFFNSVQRQILVQRNYNLIGYWKLYV